MRPDEQAPDPEPPAKPAAQNAAEPPEAPAEPSLPLALATLATSLAVVLVGGIILDVGFLIPLLVAAGVAALFGLAMGLRWEAIQDGILRLLAQGLIAILILLLVGALIGVWILGGTVPVMLSWGLDLLSPQTFLLGAFLFCALFALATGTSFGAIGSAGLALLGVGQPSATRWDRPWGRSSAAPSSATRRPRCPTPPTRSPRSPT